jgi:hypothetical protein
MRSVKGEENVDSQRLPWDVLEDTLLTSTGLQTWHRIYGCIGVDIQIPQLELLHGKKHVSGPGHREAVSGKRWTKGGHFILNILAETQISSKEPVSLTQCNRESGCENLGFLQFYILPTYYFVHVLIGCETPNAKLIVQVAMQWIDLHRGLPSPVCHGRFCLSLHMTGEQASSLDSRLGKAWLVSME